MEEELQIQKLNTWDQLLMKKLQNLATTIKSWEDLRCNARNSTHQVHVYWWSAAKGEYMGSVTHEEATKFSHNNQELGGLML